MRIVVTGGSGHIGSVLARHLHDAGHDVLNIDRRKAKRETPVPWVFAESADRTAMQPLLDGADAVAHLGELPNEWHDTPERVYARNTAATSVVMQTAADVGVGRLVYTSSCQVYPYFGRWDRHLAPDIAPFTEEHPVGPQNAYGVSKVANETYARLMGERHDLSVAVLRLPQVVAAGYGRNRGIRNRDLEQYYEFGTYLTVDDTAGAMRQLLENPRPGCEVYHAAAEDNMTQFTLTELLDHAGYRGPALSEATRTVLDCSKIHDHVGWKPQQKLEDIVAASPPGNG